MRVAKISLAEYLSSLKTLQAYTKYVPPYPTDRFAGDLIPEEIMFVMKEAINTRFNIARKSLSDLILILAFVVFAVPFQAMVVFPASIHDNTRSEAEAIIQNAFCQGDLDTNAKHLFKIGFETDNGLLCAAKLIDHLSLSAIQRTPETLTAADTLWRLTGRALVRPDRAEAIMKVLSAIVSFKDESHEERVDHPLKDDALLAIWLINKEQGKLPFNNTSGVDILKGDTWVKLRSPAALPYFSFLPITGSPIGSVLGYEGHEKEEYFWRAHPLYREAVLSRFVDLGRYEISQYSGMSANQYPGLAAIISLARWFGNSSGPWHEAYLRAFIDRLFDTGTKIFSDDPTINTEGSDVFQDASFKITGSVCSSGGPAGQCKLIDSESRGGTNFTYTQTTSLNDTASYAELRIPFLTISTRGASLTTLDAALQSYAIGGHWTTRSQPANILLDSGDESASVNIELYINLKIPACINPRRCTTSVDISTNINNPESSTASLLVESQVSGRENIALRNNEWQHKRIDRTKGDHLLKYRVAFQHAHRGMADSYWLNHLVTIQVNKAWEIKYREQLPKISSRYRTEIGWMSRYAEPTRGSISDSFLEIARIHALKHELDGTITPTPMQIPFGNLLAPMDINYAMRFSDFWSRAAFARLAIEWGHSSLSAAELNDLRTLRLAMASQSRSEFLAPLIAELNAWKFAYSALSPAPIRLVLAALIRGTSLTGPLDDAEANIVGAQARLASTEAAQTLVRAHKALESLRRGQPKVEAILTLMTLEEDFLVMEREARIQVEMLTREIAQFPKGHE